jgi:hypothetical protein
MGATPLKTTSGVVYALGGGGGGGGSVTFTEQQWIGLGDWQGAFLGGSAASGVLANGSNVGAILGSTKAAPNSKDVTELGTPGVSALDYYGAPNTYVAFDLFADAFNRASGFVKRLNLPYGTDMATVAADVYWMKNTTAKTGNMRWWLRTFPCAVQLTPGVDMNAGDNSASWNAGQNLVQAAGATQYILQKATLSPLTLTGIAALDLFDLLVARQYDGVVDTLDDTVTIFGVMLRYSRTITVS